LLANHFGRRTLRNEAFASLQSRAELRAVAIRDVLESEIGRMGAFTLNKLLQDAVEATGAAHPEDREAASELAEYVSASPLTSKMLLTNRAGELIAASERSSQFNFGGEEWWLAAWNEGKGDVFIGQPGESGALTLAVPVRAHGRAEVVGVLKASYKLDRVIETVTTVRRGRTGFAEIILPNDDVLTTRGRRPSEDRAALGLLDASPETTRELLFAGVPSLAYAAPVAGLNNVGAINRLKWRVVFRQEESDVFNLSREMGRVMGLVNLGSVLIAAAIALWLGRRLAMPLERLDAAAHKLAAGDLGERVQTSGPDEVGRLARSFNAMAEALETRIHAEQEARTEAENAESAEAANKAKSAFLANMSHELRTPLNAIIGYAELLVEEAVDADRTEFLPDLERIRSAGAHLLSLIADILDLSRIEADRMSVSPEGIDVREAVENVVATARPLAAKNQNELVVRLGPDLGSARTDAVKLRQILFNLLSNAAKFTERGVITIAATRERRDTDWIRFEVSDSGIGLTPEQIQRLFQPFSQADVSTTRKYGGTGLGLALSKRLATLLGGYIAVESAAGRGSTFALSIPAVLPSSPSSPPEALN
ncbi:MAG: sensor histidine kinase, partial [Polyangiaceae bacterium]|nr:sensor histidine kinase [Polyangiaceae bacterium]